MRLNERRVISLLEERGITQCKMAQQLHIHPTTLNGYLHAKYQHVDDLIIRDIAAYLDVSVAYITDCSGFSCAFPAAKAPNETFLLDNYRLLNPENRKVLETISVQLLKEQSTLKK